jgi:hypothetical protein
VRMDALAQWTGDLWQLSPSVFVRSRVDKAPQLPEAGAFFRCPSCGNYPLEETETGCPCKNCGRFWERRDGIYIFREEGDRPGGE